jgi:Chlamydia CHLPS protein (DUF818)
MENCLSLIPKSFVSLLSPEVEVLHEDASNSPSHRPKPSNAVYYNTFLKCVLTPIALVALPLIALIALIYSVSYCLIKKISFQDLVARKLALLALSIDPKSLEAIRIEKKPNEIVTSISDGIELSGVQILRDESTKWVVALNGTTGTWEGNLDSLSSLSKLMNANVVSFNYRGVGKSTGYCRSSENL